MQNVKKTIEVTVIAGGFMHDFFEFYDPESGDYHCISANDGYSRDDVIMKLGEELYSWLELLDDERDELLKEEAAQ